MDNFFFSEESSVVLLYCYLSVTSFIFDFILCQLSFMHLVQATKRPHALVLEKVKEIVSMKYFSSLVRGKTSFYKVISRYILLLTEQLNVVVAQSEILPRGENLMF